MPERQRVSLFLATLSLTVVLFTYSCVWAGPVIDFIVQADSFARVGGDELLIPFVVDNSILVGAAVGQLLGVAIGVGDGGNKNGEAENIDFAERLGRIHREQTGSSAPLELVTNYRAWKSSERSQRRKAKEIEQQATVLDSIYRLDPETATYSEEARRLKDRYLVLRMGRLDRTLKPLATGEGIVGLSGAFLAAGADGVAASLWAVSDESTAALMDKLYERMVAHGKPAAESLRHACLALIEDPRYAHPFFWSAFIVIGNEKAPWWGITAEVVG